MRKRRIFPAIVANTECPLSSATRNIALGRTSEITPSTSTMSSFDTFPPLFGTRFDAEDTCETRKGPARVVAGPCSHPEVSARRRAYVAALNLPDNGSNRYHGLLSTVTVVTYHSSSVCFPHSRERR